MHGQLKDIFKTAVLHKTWRQPMFKHWFKVYCFISKQTFDIYFSDDQPMLVCLNGETFIVSPRRREIITTEKVQIYHTGSFLDTIEERTFREFCTIKL